MIIDTHCHIDMYPNPLQVLNECEKRGVSVISMTSLPSHFELGYNHFKDKKKVRQALGYHPLLIDEYNETEIEKFERLVNHTSYIGEIGLDFSKEGFKTKNAQLQVFKKILEITKKNPSNKIISLHSRGAEKETLEFLLEKDINSAIFHWYSGSIGVLEKIIDAGYYFSINSAMIKSKKGIDLIKRIPLNLILIESDGPYIKHDGHEIFPYELGIVYDFIAVKHGISSNEIFNKIKLNFLRLLEGLK